MARPGAEEEDDGVLLSCVTNTHPDHPDYLLVLDAHTMAEVARAQVSVHVPAIMHGIFLYDTTNILNL